MSFEPQKVIEFDKGKQIGQTLTQHADNIPYEDTTVGAELDSINTHLSGENIASQCTINSKLVNTFVYKFGNIVIGGFVINGISVDENETLITLPSTMKSVGFMRFPYNPIISSNTNMFAQIVADTNIIVNRYGNNNLQGQATFVIPIQ